MNKTCRHVTVDNQNGLNGNTLYNMKRNKEKAICAELSFAKVTLATCRWFSPGTPVSSTI